MISRIEEVPLRIRQMIHSDVSLVSDIERRSYEFPWSHGVFRDCLLAGYHCVVLERGDNIVGYSILSVAAGEAHILNLCVSPQLRGRHVGRQMLMLLIERAKQAGMTDAFLEVRPSNPLALALYQSVGFVQIGRRKGYYQAENGREDALVLKLDLASTAGSAGNP